MFIEIIIIGASICGAILFNIWFIQWFVWMFHYVKTGQDLDTVEG